MYSNINITLVTNHNVLSLLHNLRIRSPHRSMEMNILGLNSYHGDASACIVRDGRVIAAAEEERFRRIKHWAGFPSQAIAYCLDEAQISLSDVDIVAVNSDPKAHLAKKALFAVRNVAAYQLVLNRLRNQAKRHSIQDELAKAFPGSKFNGRVERVEHHLAHISSAFLVSPFSEASVASIDGFGDFASAAWGVGQGVDIDIQDRVHFPHSLGIFYQALTQYLGFPHYGDEYKIMGLAPYGKPTQLAEMRQIVKLKEDGRFEIDVQYFRHHREKIDYAWDGGPPHVGTLFTPELESLLGPARKPGDPLEQRHRDLARSTQAMYEEAFFHLVDHLYETSGSENLALAGGCAMNSVANGKVLRQSGFRRLYVQSAAGDAGGAIGAAMYALHKYSSTSQGNSEDRSFSNTVLEGDVATGRWIMDHAYLGPSADNDDVKALLEDRSNEIKGGGCVVTYIADEAELCRITAQAIADGAVVGWFQGRMEWGPRALGNRSILCDPRRADMKDILNLKIKRRESFRPFAPSILKEYVRDWFEEDGDVPFMMQVFQVTSSKRHLIPTVTHVDGSGRLQTVYRQTNPRYWNLINAFRSLTGVPILLNTSFNENEPVVCLPNEALDCFLRTKMDMLVLGNWIVQRSSLKDGVAGNLATSSARR